MANLQAATTTQSPVPVTNVDAVHDLLKEYTLSINYKIEDGELTFWGYDTPSIWQEGEDGEIVGENLLNEFFYRLSQYIADGEKLVIRTAGFTKCRSVHGSEWVVKPHLVQFNHISGSPEIIDPPVQLAEYMDGETLDQIDEAANAASV
jgi:hypothetical protein